MKIDWQLLRFPFDDPQWQSKALIGVLLAIGSILVFPISLVLAVPLAGYTLRLMKQVIEGGEPSLLEWDDWRGLFTDGIKAWVVGFVYGLPILVVMCCFYASIFVLVPVMAAADSGGEMILAAVGSMLLFYILIFVLIAVMFVIMIPTVYFMMVAMTRLAATSSLNSAFQFGDVIRLGRKGFPNYLLAFVGLYGMIGILSLVMMAIVYSIILSCLYPVLMGAIAFYAAVLNAALFGKAYLHTELSAPSPVLAEARLTPPPVSTAPLVEKPKKPRASRKKKEAE